MRSLITLMVVISVIALTFVPLAWAADVVGKIKAVDTTGRMLVLEDGTRLAIPDNLKIDRKDLRPGKEVKASYDMVGAQKVITAIEVTTPNK